MLNDEVCQKCNLYEDCRTPFMSGSGSDNPKILFCGEAPGEQEDYKGIPFVGRSGQLLRNAIQELDGDASTCRFTNTVRCRPPQNRTPTPKEISYCSQFLAEEIARTKPQVIVLLGNSPLKAVLGESRIGDWNGVSVQRDGITYIPAFHPAYVARNMTALDEWMGALEKVFDAVGSSRNSGDSHYQYLFPKTKSGLLDMLDALQTEPVIAYDIEASWKEECKIGNRVLSVSIGVDGYAWAFPIDHDEARGWWKNVDREYLIKVLRKVLHEHQVIGHNVRFDCKQTRRHIGVDFTPAGDTMLISQLLDARPTPGLHGLKRLAGIHLGMYDYDRELRDYVALHAECDYDRGGTYANVPLSVLLPYGGKDAAATFMLEEKLRPRLDEKQLVLYHELIMPADRVLGKMESNGFKIDKDVARRYKAVYEIVRGRYYDYISRDKAVKKYVADVRAGNPPKLVWKKTNPNKPSAVPRPKPKFIFNPNSTDQVSAVLYLYKRHRVVAYTVNPNTGKKGGPSNKIAVLKKSPRIVSDSFFEPYRNWKLLNSMLSKYLNNVLRSDNEWDYGDGRSHSSYHIGGAKTGRLSSSSPNLQNIPTPEKEPGTLLATMRIKNVFTHTWEDGCLVAADYSGMELRIMAALSNCVSMKEAFHDGVDIHKYVSSKVFKIPIDQVTKDLRYRGKWCNWTLLYGGGANTLVSLYGLSKSEAEQIVKDYYKQFPEILYFQEDTTEFLKENGYVTTPLGRRLYIPDINDPDPKRVAEAIRTGVNMPIQGTASDMLLLAMHPIDDQMVQHKMKTMLVNTVHDSLVADIYPGELEQWSEICKDCMENLKEKYAKKYFPNIDLSWLDVPLKADMGVGTHYGELSEE